MALDYADWRWRRGGRFGSRFATPLMPMVGEYANMTHFITDDVPFPDWKLSPALSVRTKLQHYGWYPAAGVKYAG